MLIFADFVYSMQSQMADQEGMGGKLSSEDKKTILAAIKEKNDWMEENKDAEAEDYEEQLSELQATVGVSPSVLRMSWPRTDPSSPSLPSCTVDRAETARCRSATTSFKRI